MIARRDPQAGRDSLADRDSPADDCALDLLCDLDESLWIYDDARRADPNAFRNATRQSDHVDELRRVLYRLHHTLVEWEAETLSACPRGRPGPGPGLGRGAGFGFG
ncbi:hypothetical protein [Actinomadura rudentiformis]|uniref:Uncharacterized protein n=1 Tax=Actinomadura rudentiformis TaxID=359158 RepID=A0A6H9YF41_9ACTN|nr:hypothetical protein [Actinomadura rudentiformis]KAB2344045.1 hypothetical protein F8566_32475 [Actinomadura rudentiformis]